MRQLLKKNKDNPIKTVVDVSDLNIDDNGVLIIDFITVECEATTGDGLTVSTSAGCWLCGPEAAMRRCQRRLNEIILGLGHNNTITRN